MPGESVAQRAEELLPGTWERPGDATAHGRHLAIDRGLSHVIRDAKEAVELRVDYANDGQPTRASKFFGWDGPDDD